MKTNINLLFTILAAIMLTSCTAGSYNKENEKSQIKQVIDTISNRAESGIENKMINSTADILNKKEVPILCYHRIEDGRNDIYTVSPNVLVSHLQILSDSGFNSILPDDLYNYLVYNTALPNKPFMITFDDSRIEHFTIAAPELEKRNFRAAFFIMTVTNNKKNYLTNEEIAQLSERGHTIGLHSWDHVMVTKYSDSTFWKQQVFDPQKRLEKMINKPVEYWAYPNGVYDIDAAKELDTHFKMSFILLAKRDSLYPLQTIRRMIVPSDTPERMLRRIGTTFN